MITIPRKDIKRNCWEYDISTRILSIISPQKATKKEKEWMRLKDLKMNFQLQASHE